jgi:hypothetical protein
LITAEGTAAGFTTADGTAAGFKTAEGTATGLIGMGFGGSGIFGAPAEVGFGGTTAPCGGRTMRSVSWLVSDIGKGRRLQDIFKTSQTKSTD